MSGVKKYLIFGCILTIVYLVAQYSKPKPTNWAPTYLAEDKIPFGTYILRQQIRDVFPDINVKNANNGVYNTIKENSTGRSNLFIISSNVKINKLDYAQMVNYMKKGNSIFIAAFQINGVLLDTLKLSISSGFDFRNKKMPLNFVNPALKREFDYYFDKGIGSQYFSKIDSSKTIILGKRANEEANFVKYEFGKGALYILPNPQLLTNYILLKEDGQDYAAKALSYLPNSPTLLWADHLNKPKIAEKGILSVFLSYDQLRWAYYIALLSIVVFVFFEIKRRQRIIPIAEKYTNTSAEFVQVVGRVYYQQRDNRDIAEKKVTYWLEYLRTKYRLKTTTLDKEFKESLISISGAAEETINELLGEVQYLKAGHMVKDEQLIRLNKLIEQFYKEDQ